jgi:multiple sugar transport system permease protein
MSKPVAALPAAAVAEQPLTQVSKRPKTKNKNFKQNNLAGYLFISPWLIGFFLFGLLPLVISFALAFTDYDVLSGGEYIGLANFERMFFDDVRYGRSVAATFRYVLVSVPLRLAFALAVAMLLNTKRRGVYWYRAAYYIPSVIGGSVAVAVMWRQLFGREGLVNAVATLARLGASQLVWKPGYGDLDAGFACCLAVWLAHVDFSGWVAPDSAGHVRVSFD